MLYGQTERAIVYCGIDGGAGVGGKVELRWTGGLMQQQTAIQHCHVNGSAVKIVPQVAGGLIVCVGGRRRVNIAPLCGRT